MLIKYHTFVEHWSRCKVTGLLMESWTIRSLSERSRKRWLKRSKAAWATVQTLKIHFVEV